MLTTASLLWHCLWIRFGTRLNFLFVTSPTTDWLRFQVLRASGGKYRWCHTFRSWCEVQHPDHCLFHLPPFLTSLCNWHCELCRPYLEVSLDPAFTSHITFNVLKHFLPYSPPASSFLSLPCLLPPDSFSSSPPLQFTLHWSTGEACYQWKAICVTLLGFV